MLHFRRCTSTKINCLSLASDAQDILFKFGKNDGTIAAVKSETTTSGVSVSVDTSAESNANCGSSSVPCTF